MLGIITKSISSFYYVDTGKEIYECRARGIFKLKNINLYAGDRVEFEVLDEEKKLGNISKLFDRKNLMIRPAIANATKAILIFSVKSPDPNLSLIDRFLVLAQKENLDVVIVLNKIDLDQEGIADRIKKIYGSIGYPVIPISAEEGTNVEKLKKHLENDITVFAGPSGSGKSSTINALIETDLKTGEVSEKIGRGKHTTRHVELIKVGEGSYIADSPGFSSIDLYDTEERDLKEYFVEFHEFDIDCKFAIGCLHENEPDCKVKEAVEEGLISKERYQIYLQLLEEIRSEKRRYYK